MKAQVKPPKPAKEEDLFWVIEYDPKPPIIRGSTPPAPKRRERK